MTGLRVVALDLSMAASGIARTHTSAGEPRLSASTVLTSKTNDRRTAMDHVRVSKVFAEVRKAVLCRPDVVTIEWLPMVDLGDHSLRLAELHGLVKHWLVGQGIPYADVKPQHLKIYATGNGGASKEAVCVAVVARYGTLLSLNPRDDNQADAMTLLALTLHAYGEPLAEVPDSHRRALTAVKWPNLGASA